MQVAIVVMSGVRPFKQEVEDSNDICTPLFPSGLPSHGSCAATRDKATISKIKVARTRNWGIAWRSGFESAEMESLSELISVVMSSDNAEAKAPKET